MPRPKKTQTHTTQNTLRADIFASKRLCHYIILWPLEGDGKRHASFYKKHFFVFSREKKNEPLLRIHIQQGEKRTGTETQDEKHYARKAAAFGRRRMGAE